jgi:hypothetical protein
LKRDGHCPLFDGRKKAVSKSAGQSVKWRRMDGLQYLLTSPVCVCQLLDLKLLGIKQEHFVLWRRVYVKWLLFCDIPVGLHHSVLQQTHRGYRAHLASFLVGTDVSSSRGKGGGSWSWPLTTVLTSTLRMGGATSPLQPFT